MRNYLPDKKFTAILLLALISTPALSGDNIFDSKLSPRYIVLYKDYVRDGNASYKVWDKYISPPVHYPGAARCKGNDFYAFNNAAKQKYADEVNSMYNGTSRKDSRVDSRQEKGVEWGDGLSGPLLTQDDATDFIQRQVAYLNRLDKEMDYGEYFINRVNFSFDCKNLAAATVPASPAKTIPDDTRDSGSRASSKSSGGIILASDKPTPANSAAKPTDKNTWTTYYYCGITRADDTVNAESTVKGAKFYVSTIKAFTLPKGNTLDVGGIAKNFGIDFKSKYGVGNGWPADFCNSGNSAAEAQARLDRDISLKASLGYKEVVRTGIAPRLP